MIRSFAVSPDSREILLPGNGLAHFEVFLQGDNFRIEVNEMKGKLRI